MTTPMPSPVPSPSDGLSQTPATTQFIPQPKPIESTSTTTPATVMPSPAPGPAPDPFFTGGDWITLAVGCVASVIAFLAYRASAKSAREAEKARKAAERSAAASEDAVIEQRKSNALAERQDLRETAEQETLREQARLDEIERIFTIESRAFTEAQRVTVAYSSNAGIDVIIGNATGQTITDLRLLNVKLTEHSAWRWEPNPLIVNGGELHVAELRSGEEHKVSVVFFDEHGERQYSLGSECASLLRFTDGYQQRWERGRTELLRVPSDDSDLDDD